MQNFKNLTGDLMKTLIFIFTFFVASELTLASTKNLVPTITEQDSSEAVLLKTDRAIRTIYQKLNLGKIQIQMSSTIHEIQKEVLTERKISRSQNNYSGGLRGFLLGGSFDYNDSERSRIDITKVITANRREVSEQESNATKSLAQLQKSLNKILNDNEANLVLMKELAIIQAAAVYKMVEEGKTVPWDTVQKTFAMVKEIDFAGTHTVTRCLSTKYMPTESYDESNRSGGLKLRLLFFRLNLGGSESSQNYHQRFAHTESNCRSTTNVVKVDLNDSVYLINMNMLDAELDKWISAIDAVSTFTTPAPAFPTWGSPYYSN